MLIIELGDGYMEDHYSILSPFIELENFHNKVFKSKKNASSNFLHYTTPSPTKRDHFGIEE
jgi:hypothetical protein